MVCLVVCCVQELPFECCSQVTKLKDGTARARQSRIINAYMSRGPNGKVVPSVSHPMFTEMQRRREDKYIDEFAQGAVHVSHMCIHWLACI